MIRMYNVLLVEDSIADAQLVQMAVSKFTANVRLEIKRDGGDAITRLKREGVYSHSPLPDLIMLDLNLPTRSGRDVLSAIKNDPLLRATPVVVLTSSDDRRDVSHIYDMGANGYVTKPAELNDFMQAVSEIMAFWTTRAALPSAVHKGDE